MFVMKTGTCQRPPLQWPQEVLAAAVCFPYIVTLQPQVLSVYSMVDLQHKQSVNLQGVKGLLSTSGKQATEKSFPSCNCSIILKRRCSCARQFAPIQSIILAPERFSKAQTNLPSDGVLVYTERDIFSLGLVPFHEQIQALVQDERVEEASLLLDGVQARCPLYSHKVKCNF